MDEFGQLEFRQLVAPGIGPCVSIYMPTHVSGADGQQDPIRLRNLADQVQEQLSDGWMRGPDARNLVKRVRELTSDGGFWEQRSQGLAVFLNAKSMWRFRVPLKLEEMAIVNDCFHVKPLLPLVTSAGRYMILAFSQHSVRLLEATEHWVREVHVDSLPQRIEEALNLDGADRGSQSHFAMKGGKGKQSSVFHGQGGTSDTHKEDLSQFARQVNSALEPVLRGETDPLILAGVSYLSPIFREVCRYPNLAKDELRGNYDRMPAQQIREQAWPIARPLLAAARDNAAEGYRHVEGTGKTSNEIREVIPAANEGRVETLFVAADQQIWGDYDPQQQRVVRHDHQQRGDDDLLNVVAIQTVIHGGSVYVLPSEEMPSELPLAAVFRY